MNRVKLRLVCTSATAIMIMKRYIVHVPKVDQNGRVFDLLLVIIAYTGMQLSNELNLNIIKYMELLKLFTETVYIILVLNNVSIASIFVTIVNIIIFAALAKYDTSIMSHVCQDPWQCLTW